ncbi:hypothetical protein GGTG_12587 [Gaeumannomyces tritici R3-111a-1]|uniref:Uncharacterized protein n=1 Tax=Gaeumannomyces tritici (strain R3-111a-1) TaxID=644352 RepID=J3PGG2_GAET3|nr:hypothetical protein GGTG_12587 [Gaeumannomyces tritici R3-111a-1]EJT69704.1 hypothetical protein GGTG_12587 [Gaeumannomyces tritici R3-111a-1]
MEERRTGGLERDCPRRGGKDRSPRGARGRVEARAAGRRAADHHSGWTAREETSWRHWPIRRRATMQRPALPWPLRVRANWYAQRNPSKSPDLAPQRRSAPIRLTSRLQKEQLAINCRKRYVDCGRPSSCPCSCVALLGADLGWQDPSEAWQPTDGGLDGGVAQNKVD